MRLLKDAAKNIRKRLKAEFTSCKFSVRRDGGSMCDELIISLMVAPFAVFADLGGDYKNHSGLNKRQLLAREAHQGLCNGRLITKDCWRVMKRAMEIAKDEYDFDGEIFFLSSAIGKWDKPFERKN